MLQVSECIGFKSLSVLPLASPESLQLALLSYLASTWCTAIRNYNTCVLFLKTWQGGNAKTNHSNAQLFQPWFVHSQHAEIVQAKRIFFLAFKERFIHKGEEGKFPTFQPSAGFCQGFLMHTHGEAWLRCRGKKLWSKFYGLMYSLCSDVKVCQTFHGWGMWKLRNICRSKYTFTCTDK